MMDRKTMIGIPYMGSKRKLAKPILDYILANNPKVKHFYDLFGGGAAISLEALKRRRIKSVHYNELNAGVVELLRKIRDDGVTKEFYEWIDRDTFYKHKDDDDWRGGLIKTCWSFGNNQQSYLYSAKNEYDRKLLHNLVIKNCEKSLKEINKKYDISLHIINQDLHARKKQYAKMIKELSNKHNEKALRKLVTFDGYSPGKICIQLDGIERLLEIKNVENLAITNLSYDEVDITTPIDSTILYFDPPYFNTQKYQKSIVKSEFIEYIKNSPYKIYVSSYNLPELYECESFKHRSRLGAAVNNEVVEKLYCNRKEVYHDRLFDVQFEKKYSLNIRASEGA